MKQKDHQTNLPIIRQIAEGNQKDRKTVMQSILKEISLWTDKDMTEKSAEVLAELNEIEYFHL